MCFPWVNCFFGEGVDWSGACEVGFLKKESPSSKRPFEPSTVRIVYAIGMSAVDIGMFCYAIEAGSASILEGLIKGIRGLIAILFGLRRANVCRRTSGRVASVRGLYNSLPV